MVKMNMQTTDVVDENVKRIGKLFPHCLTEVKDEKGRHPLALVQEYQSQVHEWHQLHLSEL